MNHRNIHSNRIHSLARQKGLLRPADLEGIGAPRVVLTRMVATGQLERVARGLYRLRDTEISENESLTTIASKIPQAVICLLSALQFHELTTQLPRQVWIAMPRGSHKPKLSYPPIVMIKAGTDIFTQGMEIHQRDDVSLRIYSIEKTIADCFKHRNKIGLDVALEALKDARAKNKLNMNKLWHYAKICRVTNVIRPYLEALE